MWVIQRYSGASYWSQDEGWDELSSANKFESDVAAREALTTFNILSNTPEDAINIITLEAALKDELDTTPIPLKPKPLKT